MVRWRNQDALDEALASITRESDADELMTRLQEAGVPAGPTLAVDQIWSNHHLRERGFFQSFQEQDGTARDLPGVPWRFDGAADANMVPPPLRGEHNSYVFEDLLGLSKPEIEALIEEQVIY
jgi:crotonobetainyl-CoA:carnitine CoA-transferase CaiB-like acyl-CoA transferase